MNWLPLLVPYYPSPAALLLTIGAGWLYVRGGRERGSGLRQTAFWTGLVLLYLGWQTHLDYYAERQFFMHRIQQLVLRDIAPFLLVISAPVAALRAGIPARMRERWRMLAGRARSIAIVRALLTQPAVATIAYVGVEWFWLIPIVHYYTMLDLQLYRLMNWSMIIAGLLFWGLVLDPRESPPARLRPAYRLLLVAIVMPLGMVPGIILTFTTTNYYPLYELCGRAFGEISTRQDQSIGGLIIWIPGSLVNLAGALTTLYLGFFKSGDEPGPVAAPRR